MKEQKYYNFLDKAEFRNKLCPCGSGKKTKRCHGKERVLTKTQVSELKSIIKTATDKHNEKMLKETQDMTKDVEQGLEAVNA